MRLFSCVSATGTLLKLPGNNPVQPEGKPAIIFTDNVVPPLISPVFAYTGNSPTATGQIATPGQTNPVAPPSVVPSTANSSHTTAAVPSVYVPAVPTTHATSPQISAPSLPSISAPSIAIPSVPPIAKFDLPSPSVLAIIPTASPAQRLPPAVSPLANAQADSGSSKACRTKSNKRRQRGLEYHRQHHRSPHVPRHDFLYEATNSEH